MTTRLKAVTAVGEKTGKHGVFLNGFAVGIYALHFVEHNALVANGVVFTDFIMPALLIKNFGLFVNQRIKNGVKINVHKIEEILVILA